MSAFPQALTLPGVDLPQVGARVQAPSPAPLTCRPYQTEAIDAVLAAHAGGMTRPLIVLPTGAGKTVVFSHLLRLRAHTGRALVLAHREELLGQAVAKLRQIAPDLRIGVVKAERDEHHGADVVVASVQTLARPARLARVGAFSTIVVDEAHHAVADTYRTVLGGLGSFQPGGPLTVGVTATAGDRSDGVGLRATWEKIVYQRGILAMIADGYLVDVRGLQIETDLDLGKVATRNGDYADGSLGTELDDSGAIEAAARGYQRYAGARRGVAFTPTIATAESLAAHLVRLGIPAESVSGQTPTEERRAILHRLHTGDTQVVTNCAVLTEGFDEPAVSCVLVARPTKSRPLFVQMAGRALRTHPTKTDALVMSLYAPPSAGLATIADLAGTLPGEKALEVKPEQTLAEAAAEAQQAANRRVASALSAKEIDLFARSGLRWQQAGPGFALPAGENTLLLVPLGNDQWRVVEAPRAGRCRLLYDGVTLEMAQGVGEEHARAAGAHLSRRDAAWRRKPVSDKQRALLVRRGIPVPATSGEASDLIFLAGATRTMNQLTGAA